MNRTKISRKNRRKRLVWVHVKSPICEVYGWHRIETARKVIALTLGFAEEHFNDLAKALPVSLDGQGPVASHSGAKPNEPASLAEGNE